MLFRFVHIWFCDCLQCRCQIIIMVWFQFNFHFVPKIKTKNQTSYQQTYQSQVNKKCRKISNGTQQDVPAVAAAFLSMSSLCSSPTLSQFSRSYICSTAHCFRASQFSSAHFSSARCFSLRTSSCCAVLLLHLLRKNDLPPPPLHWYHYRDHLLVHPAGANIMVDLVQAVFEEISLERNPALWQSERDSRFLWNSKVYYIKIQHYSYHEIRDSALKLSFSLLYFYSLLNMFREDTVKRLKFLADFSETSFLEVAAHKFSSSSFFGPNVNCVTEKSMTRRWNRV